MKLFVPTLVALLAVAFAAPFNLDVVSRAEMTVAKALEGNDVEVLKGVLDKQNLTAPVAAIKTVTVFAPTDAAFAKSLVALGFDDVEEDQTERMINIVDHLTKDSNGTVDTTKILQYHVLTKTVNATALKAMTAPVETLLKETFTVKVSGANVSLVDKATKIADAFVTNETDIKLTTGVLHKIDGVMFPIAVDPAADSTKALVKILKEEFPAPSEGVCFPASAIVRTVDGQDITMADLAAGHSIRIHESARFSKVFAFSHKQHTGLHEFVRVTAASGRSIALSPSHYMYANGKMVAARAVKVGDMLRTVDGPSVVKTVERVKDFGLVAPHTMHGDVVVNGIVASTYTTTVHPHLARFLLAPVRMVVSLGLSKEPLGKSLYEGAPRMQKMMPGGPDMF